MKGIGCEVCKMMKVDYQYSDISIFHGDRLF